MCIQFTDWNRTKRKVKVCSIVIVPFHSQSVSGMAIIIIMMIVVVVVVRLLVQPSKECSLLSKLSTTQLPISANGCRQSLKSF